MPRLVTAAKKSGPGSLLIAAALFSIVVLFTMSGCAVTGKKIPEQPSADTLSNRAMKAYNHGRYLTALQLFKKIRNRFPFSKYGLKAKLREADCHYYEGHYGQAISTYQEFAQDHPSHKAMPYVLFQIGMSYARQMDTVDRDPRAAEMAEDAFKNLVNRYPDSPYITEARKQIKKARNFLARHELYVANYYIKTSKYEQAESRLEYLATHYQDSEAAPESEKVLAALKAGNPPRGNWLDWIPRIGLPDSSIFDSLSPGM